MSYTTASSVQALMARLHLNVAFSTGTTPTLAQVNTMITDIAAEIDVHLASKGYTVPITTPAYLLTWAGDLNSWGAAAIALKAYAPEQTQVQNGGPVIPAYAFYEKKYQDALKLIDSGELTIAAAEAASPVVGPSSYFTLNPDVEEDLGTIAEPSFKRDKVF